MFPNLFHISITEDNRIALSIRSQENRADKYVFSKSDIIPSLDDNPNDDEWSGSSTFRLKRTHRHGFISITTSVGDVLYKCNRQEIEILNAQLKDICSRLKVSDDSLINKSVVKEQSFQGMIYQQSLDTDKMYNTIRMIIREEIALALENLNFSTSIIEPKEDVSDIRIQPNDTFIPNDLSKNIDGNVGIKKTESNVDSALKALQKLKEIKK